MGAAMMVVVTLAAAGACGKDNKSTGATSTSTPPSSTTTASGSAGSTTTALGGSTTTTVSSTEPAGVIDLVITGGNVEGGVRRVKVKQGDQVTIRATSDVADELHLHTYDLKVDLVPGQSADLTFLAKIPGVFEVELEGRGKKVLELEVGA